MRHPATTRTLALVLPCLLFLATGSCASSGVNQGDINLVSLEEEWQLGQQLSRDLAGQLDIVQDRQAQAYIERLGSAMASQTELGQLPWQFHIVRDPEVNAFNIPGGHVYVNTGLIGAADNVAELAGVMAHEISHGVARHGTEQLTRAYGLQMVAGLALGENPPVYQQILAQIAGSGTLARFSRSAEEEADDLGVRYMSRAGYDPMGLATMFEELLSRRQSQPSSVEQFFSTHPLAESRIRDVREAASRVDRQGLRTTDPTFQQIQRRLGVG